MDRRHRAGFTYGLSKLKPRASEKMGGHITNNEDFFLFITLKRLPRYLLQIDLKVGSYMPTSRLLSLLRRSHLKLLRLT